MQWSAQVHRRRRIVSESGGIGDGTSASHHHTTSNCFDEARAIARKAMTWPWCSLPVIDFPADGRNQADTTAEHHKSTWRAPFIFKRCPDVLPKAFEVSIIILSPLNGRRTCSRLDGTRGTGIVAC